MKINDLFYFVEFCLIVGYLSAEFGLTNLCCSKITVKTIKYLNRVINSDNQRDLFSY